MCLIVLYNFLRDSTKISLKMMGLFYNLSHSKNSRGRTVLRLINYRSKRYLPILCVGSFLSGDKMAVSVLGIISHRRDKSLEVGKGASS